MGQDSTSWFGRWRLGGACAAYALLILYASTVIGPSGVNFVYRDPVAAFRNFLATPYVINGSDQRADWMGNLLMLVPFGFLMAALLWPRRANLGRSVLKLAAAAAAILISVVTILTIKYLQLFFPPRTVTLNYIAAQTLGAAIGCAGFAFFHERIGRSVSRRDPVAALVMALRFYFAMLVIFLLMPLDFALDATDLRTQIDRLPEAMISLPGGNRPTEMRAILIVVAGAAFIPVGMLLTFVKAGVYRVQRRPRAVAGWGLLITTVIFALTVLVISAYPVMAAIAYRTCGILAGAGAILWLTRQDPAALRQRLRWWAPCMAVVYVAALLSVSGLLSVHWLFPRDAMARVYPLGLLPLFDYYIVSKAEAAKNIVGHALLYAPIGVLFWMRYDTRRGGRVFLLAAAVAFLVELARYFRPGLEGDINTVALAGLSAMLAARLMPDAWFMLTALVRQSAAAPVRQWRLAGRPGPSDGPDGPVGETEDF
jgi:VanZ family protein